ncbi:DUF1833 family protein [Salipiger bermudensis]|uniref:Uncharacterized protein n=1 Tax=Salipiger bermudensis (strain DSM 26914 / JCM 13377 / KCTC 12554 / HTCC2601) TaxID=314265 RepID=Q0FLN1_SALBH|nr:DUF1833 family protein [Salipiger bermudensis]EAU45067.1 hypothetical protein R2601_22811 [Salipiger bermudensis HTCC2601]
MRNLSDRLLAATYAQESAEVFVPIVKLTHSDWTESVRWVRDTVALVHGGETYSPFPFDLALPEDKDEGFPVLRFSAQNVTREIIGQLRKVRNEVLGEVSWVLAATPDVVEMGPFEVQITGIEYDALTINGVMTIEPILEEQFGFLEMTPSVCPGLF